jgi:nitroimidazol reductase NimA-like FMN-containing flavoprotein (pyridoxamine 5'-phosphate oxidase superfamily)
MVIEQMTDRECRELLARTHIVRLACCLDNQPYVVPIDVDYFDGFFYGFSMLGKKIEWMRINPLVCVEIDELTTRRHWESVIILGEYEELTKTAEHANARVVAERLFQRHPIWWEPATVALAGGRTREPVLFRILITRLTGRRARPDKDEIEDDAPEGPPRRRTRLGRALMNLFGNRRRPSAAA